MRKVLQPIADANKKKINAMDAYVEVARCEAAWETIPPSWVKLKDIFINENHE